MWNENGDDWEIGGIVFINLVGNVWGCIFIYCIYGYWVVKFFLR